MFKKNDSKDKKVDGQGYNGTFFKVNATLSKKVPIADVLNNVNEKMSGPLDIGDSAAAVELDVSQNKLCP